MDTAPVYTPTVNSPKDNKHTDSLIPISVNTVNKLARIGRPGHYNKPVPQRFTGGVRCIPDRDLPAPKH